MSFVPPMSDASSVNTDTQELRFHQVRPVYNMLFYGASFFLSRQHFLFYIVR